MDALQLLWQMVLALAQIMLAFWPITAVILLMALIRCGVYLYKTRRYKKAGIAAIDKLSGKEFEEYLEVFFKQLGYQVQRTPYQGDYGADLILRQGDIKTAVQAKRYNRNVGVKAVQEAVAAKDYYHCDKVMVVTNSSFTPQAQTLAKANQVELWDRDELVAHLLSRSTAVPAVLPTTAPLMQTALPASTAPTCATCGKPLSARVYEYCIAHADIFHGASYCYEHQQAIRTIQPAQ